MFRQVLAGLLLGLLGIGLILAAFRFEEGVIFDTRSVLLAVSGLYLGAIPTLVAMAMTAAFRLWLGGVAMWPGVAVIICSGAIGILWRQYRRRPLVEVSWRELFCLGVVVHVVMLALMLLLPWENARRVLVRIGPPVLLVYPVATIMLGLLLANRLRREAAARTLAESESFTKAVLDNLPVGIAVNSANPEVKFSYMNDNFPKVYRTTREALAAQDNFWNAVYQDPATREAMRQRVLADCATGEVERMHWADVPIKRTGGGNQLHLRPQHSAVGRATGRLHGLGCHPTEADGTGFAGKRAALPVPL